VFGLKSQRFWEVKSHLSASKVKDTAAFFADVGMEGGTITEVGEGIEVHVFLEMKAKTRVDLQHVPRFDQAESEVLIPVGTMFQGVREEQIHERNVHQVWMKEVP
jgi:hypothetical protein